MIDFFTRMIYNPENETKFTQLFSVWSSMVLGCPVPAAVSGVPLGVVVQEDSAPARPPACFFQSTAHAEKPTKGRFYPTIHTAPGPESRPYRSLSTRFADFRCSKPEKG